eukprot:12978155-Alexandrium_andersonii.AAC.1
MAETAQREADSPPQSPSRALSGSPPDGRLAMGERSPIVRRTSSGASPERTLKGLCGVGVASL